VLEQKRRPSFDAAAKKERRRLCSIVSQQAALSYVTAFTRNLEQAYRGMWRNWCNNRPGWTMATSITEMLAQGWKYQRAGEMLRAEEVSRQILQADPGNVAALRLLSASLQDLGRLSEAVGTYQKGLQVNQTSSELHNDLGVVLAMQGRLDEAIASFERVVKLKPSYAEGHNNLGNALRNQGRLEEAIACFRESLRLKPTLADAHSNLGLALLAQGQTDQAIAASRQALILRPNDAEALASLKKALQLNPNIPEAHNTLGNILARAGQRDEAIASYRQALRLKPTFAEAHSNLGIVLCKQGLLDEGIACFQEAQRQKPDYAEACNNLGNAFKDQGQLDEALACMQRARQIKPHEIAFHTNVLGTLNYHPRYDAAAIFEEHRRWEREHVQVVVAADLRSARAANDPSPERRLRIGYVSPDFSSHVVGRNVWPLLHNHDHDHFEITLYANMTHGDSMTEQFQ
jgi:tetratricopeptide (TPR) repeat protein